MFPPAGGTGDGGDGGDGGCSSLHRSALFVVPLLILDFFFSSSDHTLVGAGIIQTHLFCCKPPFGTVPF